MEIETLLASETAIAENSDNKGLQLSIVSQVSNTQDSELLDPPVPTE